MRKAAILQQAVLAGVLEELTGGCWHFSYKAGYAGKPVSLTMPVTLTAYEFDRFPPVFEGLLPEGEQLEVMLQRCKIERHDLFRQLVVIGQNLVGSLAIREIPQDAA